MDDITCLMLYYGRKDVAEESVESFLRQTHPNKKLVIVNSHPDPLYFDTHYHNIEVHNCKPDTFNSLNDKYKYALSQVKSSWWSPWDSDDIWLPWHLENLVKYIPKAKSMKYPRKIGIQQSYFMFGKEKKIYIGWQMWGCCIWESYDKDGNFHAVCDPKSIENCDKQVVFQNWERFWIDGQTNPISFIFRWHVSKNKNRSAQLGEEGIQREKKIFQEMIQKPIKEPLRPHWDIDYVDHVKGDHETYSDIQPE